jgi:hypothetical protein
MRSRFESIPGSGFALLNSRGHQPDVVAPQRRMCLLPHRPPCTLPPSARRYLLTDDSGPLAPERSLEPKGEFEVARNCNANHAELSKMVQDYAGERRDLACEHVDVSQLRLRIIRVN